MSGVEDPYAEIERLRAELDTVAGAYDELLHRRVVRAATGVADFLAPAYRRVQGPDAGDLDADVAPYDDRPLLAAIAAFDDRSVAPVDGRVSIIIPTRNHHDLLAPLLDALETSTHRDVEVIVVDNGSSDETADLTDRADKGRHPLRVVHNDVNRSYSQANNQGVALATGEFVLLLNDDIVPMHSSWLSRMLEVLTSADDVSVVGALLFEPAEPPDLPLRLQHRGIGFAWAEAFVRPRNLGNGDVVGPDAVGGPPVDVPATTGACLLMRRSDLEALGGLCEDYVYGYEDVDLCLSAPGRVVVTPDAALLHRESTSQHELPNDFLRLNRLHNRRQLMKRHGRSLRRRNDLELVAPSENWRNRPRTVGITVSSADPEDGFGDYYTGIELGGAFADDGWDMCLLAAKDHQWADSTGCDLIVSLLQGWDPRTAEPGAVTVAWIRNVPDKWLESGHLDHFDLVVSSSVAIADFVERHTGHPAMVVPLASNAERFTTTTEPSPTFASDFLLTTNYWGVPRLPVHQLELRDDERFIILGDGWEMVPSAAELNHGSVPYELLPAAYASTAIALDETTEGRLEYGAVNSRVFDALATGTLVVTDNAVGSDECFDGKLPVYQSMDELRKLLDHYLENPDERRRLADDLRSIVLERHTYEHRARDFQGLVHAAIDRPQVSLLVGAPRWEIVNEWGDFHFARGFLQALRRWGMNGRIRVIPEWERLDTFAGDVVVHLRGITPYRPSPGRFNVLWLLSHAELLDPSECDEFDLVLVASAGFADQLRPRTSTPVVEMLQATEARPSGLVSDEPMPEHDLVFVGNTRASHRHGVEWALEGELPLTIYGKGWEHAPRGVVADEEIDNRRVRELYGASSLVLNDHWPDMVEHGFVSNRIFDALAAGALCVSDAVPGIDEIFEGAVPVYRDRDELIATVGGLLADPVERQRRAAAGQATVLGAHTFDHRAAQFVALLPDEIRAALPAQPAD